MTNAWPAEWVALFDACKAGDVKTALPLYRLLTPAFHLDTDVKLVQYIKLAEHFVYGAPEHTRKPRLAIEGDERAMVETIIKATIAGLSRSA
jgi:4-hydroxy-tetrahydrodipicolinate synthase